ncbi:MAG: hypothetical protein E6R04_06265 [Spirochaetes bacterium]|nr:MAG: hypothetical protein E6R04_06265 [Spirochaetota bacterium]
MATYAANTEVSVDRSRAEIERTLTRYGAKQFLYGWDHSRAVVGFVIHNRQVRFLLPLPDRDDPSFSKTPTGKTRTAKAASDAFDQEVRSRWRSLSLVIKAKLEAVAANISHFDSEFLANIVLPNGQTVGEVVTPRIEEAYETGHTPELLPGLSSPRALPRGTE